MFSSNSRKNQIPVNSNKHIVPPIPPHNPKYNKASSSVPSEKKATEHKSSAKPAKREISSSTEEASDGKTVTKTTTTTTVTTVTTTTVTKNPLDGSGPLYFDLGDFNLSPLDDVSSSSNDNNDSKVGPPDESKKSSNYLHSNNDPHSTSSNSDSKAPMFTAKSPKLEVPNNPYSTNSPSTIKPSGNSVKIHLPNGGSTHDSSDKGQKKIKRMESAPIIHAPIPSDENYERNTMATKSLIDLSTSPKHNATTEKKPGTETPRQYLERLQYTLSKSKLATVLAKKSDAFHQSALKAYMEAFDFEKDPIDIALRKFLMECHLPKETQQIDRVIEAFAKRYHEANPDLFASSDASHTLAFALLMLHTDTFNKNVKRKMTKEQFVNNTRIEGVHPEILEILYDNITFAQFTYAEDDIDVNGQTMIESPADHRTLFSSSKDRRKQVRHRNNPYWVIQNKLPTEFKPRVKDIVPMENPYSYMGTLPALDVGNLHRAFSAAQTIRITGVQNRHKNDGTPLNQHQSAFNKDDETILLKMTKIGRLGKKVDMVDGKKKGNFSRNWRQYGVILSGSQVMFFKDEVFSNTQIAELKNPEKSKLLILRPDAILMTADSVAVYDRSYKKYSNVFRLVCPKGCQYLFQVESEIEMNDWISKINYAATFKTVGLKIRNVRSNSFNKKKVGISGGGNGAGVGTGLGGGLNNRDRNYDGNGLLGPTKDDSSNKDSQGRANFLRSKIDELQEKISTLTSQLQTDIRLRNNLILMIPYKSSTRDRIIQMSVVVAQRLKHTCLELSRLVCYHEILEKDLCATVMENSSYWQHRNSMYRVGESSQEPVTPRLNVDIPMRKQLGASEVYTGGHVLVGDPTSDDELNVAEESKWERNDSLLSSDSANRTHLRLTDRRPIDRGLRATTLDILPISPISSMPSTPSSSTTGSIRNEYEEFSYLANSSELELEVVQTPSINIDIDNICFFGDSIPSIIDGSTSFGGEFKYNRDPDGRVFEMEKFDFEKIGVARERSNEEVRVDREEIGFGAEDEISYKRSSGTRVAESLYTEIEKTKKSDEEDEDESESDEEIVKYDKEVEEDKSSDGDNTEIIPSVVVSEAEDNYQDINGNDESEGTIEDMSASDSEDEFVDCEEWYPE